MVRAFRRVRHPVKARIHEAQQIISYFGAANRVCGLPRCIEDFVSKLVAYLQQRGIGWTAWSWFNDPFLVNRYAPTNFGALVRQQLAAP